MHLDMQILVGAGEMANKIEFNGEEVKIPSFGVYLFEQAKKEAYNKALDDLFNTPSTDKHPYTMTEFYEKPCNFDFDEGWNECYRDFKDIADRLREKIKGE